MKYTDGLKIGDILCKTRRDTTSQFNNVNRVKILKIINSGALTVVKLDGDKGTCCMSTSLQNFELEKREIYEIY